MPTPVPTDSPNESVIRSKKDFEKDDAGLQKYWTTEFDSAERQMQKFWRRSDQTIAVLIDKRPEIRPEKRIYKINLFASNTQTQRSILYGNTPEVVVDRRFSDANDDEARVAGEMLERVLNTDIAYDSDTYAVAIGQSLDDRLTVGFGNARIRYEADYETQPDQPAITGKNPITGALDPALDAPAVEGEEKVTREKVCVDYISWRDQLYSIGRTFGETRWWAFRSYLSRDEMTERFGAQIAKTVPYSRSKKDGGWRNEDAMQKDPWERCEVWETWSKERKKVYWYVKGYKKILQSEDDPYGLEGFWPFPRPMMANLTTSSFMPTSDYNLAQDLYDEFDTVSTRIRMLTKAVKVVGLYNAVGKAIPRLLQETFDNDMIPMEGWANFVEKGGIAGNMQFLPLTDIVGALDKLRDYRQEVKALLDEITGMGDVIRGAAQYVGNGPATATEQSIKSTFASVRMQALQDEFARFASDIQRLKAEIICKQFSPQTIKNMSNITRTFESKIQIDKAMELLKSDFFNYRVEVKSDKIAMTDFTKLKNERVQFMEGLSNLVTAAGPMLQTYPVALPFLMQCLKWTMTSFQGSQEIGGVIDQAIAKLEQQAQQAQDNPPPQQQDPKVQAQQMKAQADLQKQQADLQGKMQEIQAGTQADVVKSQLAAQTEQQKQAARAEADIVSEQAKQRMDLQKSAALEIAKPPPPPPIPGAPRPRKAGGM